ncbi:MAG: hypothetical protein IJ572_00985 [Bacilli bacterium]|nr:hypothetical protein [Bacilli bacterium]
MLNKLINNRYFRLFIILIFVPIFYIGISFGLELINHLGRILGNYLSCIL